MKKIYNCGEYNLEVISKLDDLEVESDKYRLAYVIKGILIVKVLDRVYDLKENDYLLINTNKTTTLEWKEKGLICIINFSKEYVKRYYKEGTVWFWCDSINIKDNRCDEVRYIINNILDIVVTLPKNSEDIRLTMSFYKLLSILFSYAILIKENISENDKIGEIKNKIIEYIEENYNTSITLKELSNELYLTYHYLSRNFKVMFGKSFNDYVNKVRLSHAIEDLLYTKKNITEIAIDNGYSSSSVFNRIFREKFNQSPTEYKKKFESSIDCISEIKANKEVEKISKEKIEDGFEVIVNVNKNECFNNPFNKMINIGYTADLQNSKLQSHILKLKNELGFEYFRFWNPFSDEMCIKDGEEINLNFEKINEIFDFFVKNSIKPFIELSDKPKLIVNSLNKEEFEKRMIYENSRFKSNEEFYNLLKIFINHIIERYGVEEVSKWKYELWSNPFRLEKNKEKGISEFLKKFDNVYAIIKGKIPTAFVGGGGISGKIENEKFFSEWSKHTHPDFISKEYYPYSDFENKSKNINYDADIDDFYKEIKKTKNYMKNSNIQSLLYVTEWNSVLSSRDPQNDSSFQAAYCMINATKLINKVDIIGWWCGSDIYTSYNTNLSINGGSGTITVDGICKPIYYAFKFLNKLYKYLICTNENCIITTDKCDNYSITCNNYKYMNYKNYMKSEIKIGTKEYLFKDKIGTPKTLQIKLTNITNGKYRYSIDRLGPTRGSMLNEVEKLNLKEKILYEDALYLKNKCIPERYVDYRYVKDEELILNIELEIEEIALIKISKINYI